LIGVRIGEVESDLKDIGNGEGGGRQRNLSGEIPLRARCPHDLCLERKKESPST
jgi:hypothetical protein